MQLLNTLLIGITAGSIYALMAIAFVLVWRSTRVVNFAQAGMALLSTYFGYEAVSRIGSFWVALPVAMIGGAIFAALVELILMRLLVKHASSGPIAGVAPIIATLGLLGVIRAVISMIWGGQDLRIVAPISNDGFTINGSTLVFSPLKLLILVAVVILLILLSILFQKTNLGLAAAPATGGTILYDPYVAADFNAGGIENKGTLTPDKALMKEIIEERYVSLYGTILPFNDARRLRKTENDVNVPIPFTNPTATKHPERVIYAQNEINSNPNLPNPLPDLYAKTQVNQ